MYARKYNRGSQGPGGNVWKAACKRWGRFNFYVYMQPLIHSPHFINVPSLTFPPDFPLFRHVRPLGAFNCLQSELGRPWGLKVKFWFSSFFCSNQIKRKLVIVGCSTLKIKKICFSPKVSIQPCRPKSASALPGAIWTQFRPKKLNQKAIPAHVRAHFSPGTKSARANWTVLTLI